MAKRGPKEMVPTKGQRDTVRLHAMVGTDQETIARVLGIDPKTLRKYFRDDLDISLAIANAEVGGHLFNKAKNGDTSAQIFWLKTRARWKEGQDLNVQGAFEIKFTFGD